MQIVAVEVTRTLITPCSERDFRVSLPRLLRLLRSRFDSRQWSPEFDAGSLTWGGGDFEFAFKIGNAMAHVFEAVVEIAHWAGVNPFSVIDDGDFEAVVLGLNFKVHGSGAGMFLDVVKGLFDDQE